MKVIGVIPARFESARLQGKPLALIGSKTMIEHVYTRASRSELLSDLVVATDDERIFEAVEQFGGKAAMTSREHPSGTDRVAEVAENSDADVVVNIQGDEPFLSPRVLDQLVEPFYSEPAVEMTTLARLIEDAETLEDPNVVKVVFNRRGDALYFSRSVIPHPRRAEQHRAYEHIGLYGFRRDFLLAYARLEPTPLERIEALEQLRALENGRSIRVVVTEDHLGLSVDTPADLARANAFLAERPDV
ncbi:MAG: 3-deoxy-manno-octulosonate cytidylyltransferase [Acidobacteria bacterium]|nr:3-deoxy-manno-octulosonate cytidylyltransferase [Acidobacteriota bacterium]